MSSLRNLLDKADIALVPVVTYHGDPQGTEIYFRGSHCNNYDSSHNYQWYDFCWDVPTACVCKIQFEIWGGGGGGSGSCCCMTGGPAAAGAYNKQTVCLDGVNHLDNCRYCICVASITCKHAANGGHSGCKSYITGPGLDNFCACGGCYGYSCCNGWYNGYMGCGWYNIQCKWAGTSWNRWQSDHGPESQEERDAKKEEGSEYWGLNSGYKQADCCNENWCMYKNITPMGAYIEGKMGTWGHIKDEDRANCGGHNMAKLASGPWNGGNYADCWRNGPPGMGGQGAQAYGGGCCYGNGGAAGLAKITYYCHNQ